MTTSFQRSQRQLLIAQFAEQNSMLTSSPLHYLFFHEGQDQSLLKFKCFKQEHMTQLESLNTLYHRDILKKINEFERGVK